MVFLDEYRSAESAFSMPSFVHTILRENGTYVYTMLFGKEKVTSHNPIFGVILHPDPSDAWVSSSMKYQATICYDMRHLRLDRGCVQHETLRDVFENILQCKVTLLGFSSFERALGLYTSLFDLLLTRKDDKNNEYCCLFRRETSSITDMYLHLVLQCFLRRRSECTCALWQCDLKQNWFEFFDDPVRFKWYHDYVMLVVDAARRDGYSIANVDAASHAIKCGEAPAETNEELATTRAKQALLNLLKKAYIWRFK
jgi:hypothetical protein